MKKSASGKKVSRQLELRKRRTAAGLCPQCGKPKTSKRWSCDACAKDDRERKRAKHGFQAHEESGKGRPPIAA